MLPGLPAGTSDERLASVLQHARFRFPLGADVAWAKSLARMVREHEAAEERFSPAVFHGPITVFRPMQESPENFQRNVALLKRLASGNVEVVDIPGDHFSITSGEGAAAIARWYLSRPDPPVGAEPPHGLAVEAGA